MKITIKIAFLLFLFVGNIFSDGFSDPHPGYVRTSIQPSGTNMLVGGLGSFSNGDLAVCKWGNPGEVWVLKNPATGGAGSHNHQRFAFGMQQSLGCLVVDDTLYIMQMGELTQLIDHDNDGEADEYRKINDAFATSESLLGYAYDLEYMGGDFYAVLASDVGWGGMNVTPELEGRSRWIKLKRDNTVEDMGSGFRNPDGMGKGFGNQLFAVDNQGSWIPSSKINHLQQGNFYGHYMSVGNVFQPADQSINGEWPMAWLPHGEVSNNPGGLTFIKNGLFANQFLFAELQTNKNRVYRISVEEVNGVYQGAVLAFAGGFSSGTSRMTFDGNDNLYVGLLGSHGGWNGLNTMNPGLYRMAPRDNDASHVFEILRVRSMGSGQIALDFTEAVESAGNQTGKYSVETWTFDPQRGYGAGNALDRHNLNVTGATLSNSNQTVTLNISGLQEGYLVKFTLNNLRSSSNEVVWGNLAWFTLNKFGPGRIPQTAGCKDPAYTEYDAGAAVDDPNLCFRPVGIQKPRLIQGKTFFVKRNSLGNYQFKITSKGDYHLELFNLNGKKVYSHQGFGPESFTPAIKIEEGIYLGRLSQNGFLSQSRSIALY